MGNDKVVKLLTLGREVMEFFNEHDIVVRPSWDDGTPQIIDQDAG
jgi:hypothetical protein